MSTDDLHPKYFRLSSKAIKVIEKLSQEHHLSERAVIELILTGQLSVPKSVLNEIQKENEQGGST